MNHKGSTSVPRNNYFLIAVHKDTVMRKFSSPKREGSTVFRIVLLLYEMLLILIMNVLNG